MYCGSSPTSSKNNRILLCSICGVAENITCFMSKECSLKRGNGCRGMSVSVKWQYFISVKDKEYDIIFDIFATLGETLLMVILSI